MRLNYNICDFFNEFEGELELPESDAVFDSSKIQNMVMEQIQQPQAPRRLIKLLRTVFIAAVVVSLLTTTVFAVGKLLEVYYPKEDEVFAVRPITITGYNGETVTDVIGYDIFNNVNLVLNFAVSSPNATIVAYQTKWLPDGTQFIGEQNLSDENEGDKTYIPNSFLETLNWNYLRRNYNKDTRSYKPTWLEQRQYHQALKDTGLTEQQASEWLVMEQYICPEGGFNIEIYEANSLYDRDVIIQGCEFVEILKESESDDWITLTIAAYTKDDPKALHHLLMYNKNDEFLVHICGQTEADTLERIGENLTILVTSEDAGDDFRYWDDELSWRFLSLGYGIG